jgi:hypothetical protein
LILQKTTILDAGKIYSANGRILSANGGKIGVKRNPSHTFDIKKAIE